MHHPFNLLLRLFIINFIFWGIGQNVYAQKYVVNTAVKAKKKISFISKWGPYTGNTKAQIKDIKQLVQMPLVVIDSLTKEPWEIVKFNFGWRRKDIFDDVDKGTKKVIFIPHVITMVGENKIPESWQKEIEEYVTSGEQFMIEEIIIRHPKTKEARMCKPILITVL